MSQHHPPTSLPSPAIRPLDRVLARLEGVRRSGDGYAARCPHHQDAEASLSIKEGADGRVLVHCFRGCANIDLVQSMGLSFVDLFLPGSRERQRPRVWKGIIPISAHGRPSLESFGDPVSADMIAELVRLAHVNGTLDARIHDIARELAAAVGVSDDRLAEAVRAALASEAVA